MLEGGGGDKLEATTDDGELSRPTITEYLKSPSARLMVGASTSPLRIPLLNLPAGLTYCALGALSLLGHLHPNMGGISSHDNLTRWLVSRQVPFEHQDRYNEEDYEDPVIESTADEEIERKKAELESDGIPTWAGFNGRCNKRGDTCYSFWVGGSLDLLKKLHLIDLKANRRFLLEKTQHFIGGFSKLPTPGSPPGTCSSWVFSLFTD